MALGYFVTLAEAETYFEEERLETEAWDDLIESSPTLQRSKCLMQAYNRLYYSKEFILPTLAEASADELPVLQKAQAEMAYYIALQLGEDRRKGLQAQGVIEAGVVKEKYTEDMLKETPIPPFVRDLLCGYLSGTPATEFGMVDLCRDENEPVNDKVCDF